MYQGISIIPYIDSAHADRRTLWYNPWDVASVCIWDITAIAHTEAHAEDAPV